MPMKDCRCLAGHEFEALVKADAVEEPCREEGCELTAAVLPSYGRSLEKLKGKRGDYANLSSVRFNLGF